MASSPSITPLRLKMNRAIAASLDLSDFVSSTDFTGRLFPCDGVEHPRFVLSRLILGWVKNDQSLMASSLGSRAQEALGALLRNRTWPEMGSDLWRITPPAKIAVGYRLSNDIWERERDEATMDVVFGNRTGIQCGNHPVRFVRTEKAESSFERLRVDNSDLEELLRLIAACAGSGGTEQ